MKKTNVRETQEGPVQRQSEESENLVLNAVDLLYGALQEENESEELEAWIESMKTPGTYGTEKAMALVGQIRIERQKYSHIQVLFRP